MFGGNLANFVFFSYTMKDSIIIQIYVLPNFMLNANYLELWAVYNHWTGLDWTGLDYWTPSKIQSSVPQQYFDTYLVHLDDRILMLQHAG